MHTAVVPALTRARSVSSSSALAPGRRVEPKATRPFQGGFAEVQGKEIVYLKELQPKQSAFANFEGFPQYEVALEHGPAGAGVRVTGDKPVSKVVFWSIPTTVCPEYYVDLSAEPGAEAKWTYTYSFYPLKR